MQIALISSVPDLQRIPRTGIHLVLSHLLDDEAYTAFYQERRATDYIIMDNGAHENGLGELNESLLVKAKKIGAHEVVLPDVLFDRRGTVERTRKMLRWLVGPGWESYCSAGCPRLMVVPQAKERAEWKTCLRSLLDAWDTLSQQAPKPFESPVIGISKDYDTWRGGLARLISDYVEPLYSERDLDVHCLGWPNNLWSIAEVARAFPWVRSTDSAKPFVYGRHCIQLEPGGKIPRYPRRLPDFFTKPLTEQEWVCAMRNVEVYRAAATNCLVLEEAV